MKAISKSFYLKVIFIFALCLQGCSSETSNSATDVKLSDQSASKKSSDARMVFIKGGEFLMGSDEGMPFEAPVHKVSVDSFWIDAREVTVAEYAEFVKATKYVTEAERFGWSGVFDVETLEWTRSGGANWRNPDGDGKQAPANEPVTQISWNDANEYAKWAGKRLPTEAEWEYAARGGLQQNTYSWGNDLRPGGKPVANWWQGEFPAKNTAEDGFLKRAPVGSFAPNGFGLYDTAGNVWEWTADWFDANFYENSPKENPKGAANGTEKALRGGSWMCAENFCSNYRVAGRSRATPDTGLNNVGFRCVKDE
jgi:formylglycine-generating enzyme required for sulfatase activity